MVEDTTLRKYLDGTLDDQQSQALKAELEQSPDLRNRLEELRRGTAAGSDPVSGQSAHMGAMTEQVDRDIMPPTTEASEDTDTGITPHTEITPG